MGCPPSKGTNKLSLLGLLAKIKCVRGEKEAERQPAPSSAAVGCSGTLAGWLPQGSLPAGFLLLRFLDITFAAFTERCSAFFRPVLAAQGRGRCFVVFGLVPLFAMDEVPIAMPVYNPAVADRRSSEHSRGTALLSQREKLRGAIRRLGRHAGFVRLKADPGCSGAREKEKREFTGRAARALCGFKRASGEEVAGPSGKEDSAGASRELRTWPGEWLTAGE
ncbi:hypothetical protein KOW79_007578 [Hemibagrus wyckioides]|uniref:Uncharacterized protein n=1 Tax=Hemibagrus wyckioides TaxID=337641 RepID=A0A9D3SRR6_9TELE|nr:hypothetical protein KOW79_007578 [Hemibagrus wyckioides]